MIKKYLAFWVLLFPAFIPIVFSQSQISIKSAFDSSVLSYATVFNLTKKTFGSANGDGVFNIDVSESSFFRISYIGHEDLNFIPNLTKRVDTIYLKRKIPQLKEVVIQTCKKTYEEKLSSFENKKQMELFGGVSCTKGETNGKIAVHINANATPAKLLSTSFWLKKLSFMPDYAVNSPLAISFYTCSETTNLPGDLLYDKPIFYFPTKDGKQTLKIDSLNIHVPKEGIYVSFEFIMDEKFQWEQKSNDSTFVYQGVHIDGSLCEGFELAFFDYKTNSWKIHPGQSAKRKDKLHGSIKIEYLYRCCKE